MLYHVTKWRRVASIRKQGLVRGKRPTWTNLLGMYLGSRSAVYLCSTEDSAIRLAGRLELGLIAKNYKDIRIAIIDVEPTGITTEPDPAVEGDVNGWLMTRQDIPATAIKHVRMLTLDMLQRAVARLNKRDLTITQDITKHVSERETDVANQILAAALSRDLEKVERMLKTRTIKMLMERSVLKVEWSNHDQA